MNAGPMPKVPCPECGVMIGKSGMGRHARAHADAKKAAKGKKALEALVRTAVPEQPVAALPGDPGAAPGPVSTLEVAMAVLLKLSPDGRMPVAALPEVLGWIEHTDHVVKAIGSM